MRLIRWSVEHPSVVLAGYAGLLALALLSAFWLVPLRLTPALPSPLLAVVTEVMDMPAEQVEVCVTTPLERGLMGVPGVRAIRSSSNHGMSMITLEFGYGYDMQRARQEVTDCLASLQPGLRMQGVVRAGPRVVACDPLNPPVLRVAVRASGWDASELSEFLDGQVLSRLRQVEGVELAYRFGGQGRGLEVMVDRDRLAAAGLSMLDLRRVLEEALRVQSPGALVDPVGPTTLLRLQGGPNARELDSLIVATREGRPVRLRELAHLEPLGSRDAPRYRYNGQEAVELNVVQGPNASSPHTIRGVLEMLEQVRSAHPGLQYEVACDNAHFVERVQRNLWLELGLAVCLTGLVVFLFLGDLRGTLIALATVPASLAGAVVMFAPLGLSFNTSTLVGLLLAVGRLVDDTIVDLDAVRRHLAMGKDARSATIDGCSEVRRAVVGATLVICLAMVPLTMCGGLTQDMFAGIVWPFLMALAASLLVALTLTPLLASRAYQGVTRPCPGLQRWLGRLDEGYRGLLDRALGHPGLVLTAAACLVYLGCMLFPKIGCEMMPLSDTSQLDCVLESRPGTSTEETARLTARLEAILLRQPEVRRVSSEIGLDGRNPDFSGYAPEARNMARLLVTLADPDERQRSIWEVADSVQAEAMVSIPNLRRLSLREMGSDVMATSMAPVELVIRGPGLERLAWLAERTCELAPSCAPGLVQVATSWSLEQPAWNLRVDGDAAAAVGLSPAQVAEQVFYALRGGEVSGRLPDGGTLMLSYREEQRRTPVDLGKVRLIGSTAVTLSSLIEREAGLAPDRIQHDQLQRSISVSGSYRRGGSMQPGMDLWMASRMELPYPAGYTIEPRGDMGPMMDSFRRLLQGLGLALVLIYLALAAQFSSARLPLALMAAIPLELPGITLALCLAHQTFSSVSILGVLVLSGMDATAAILLLDAVLRREARGAPTRQAVLLGAPERLRPVLMTVLVTLAVMLPLALFPRTGMDAYAPLATVVVGGLCMSTLLTLVVVPVLFSLLRSDPRLTE